jgi:NRPS condensation-like uncharacterized protein
MTRALTTVRRPRRAAPPTPIRAFGVVDEVCCYFDSAAEPNNVHLEAWLPGHVDAERLREAVAAVLDAQPRARVRRAAAGSWRRGYAWEFPPRHDHDPVSVTSWRAEAELDSARAGFMAIAPPLDQSPPFRLLLASGPGLDSLIINAHHAAFDGRSCLLLLRLIADQYSGADTRPPPTDPAAADRPVPPEPRGGLPGGSAVPANRLGLSVRSVARIAPQHEKARAPGYGYRLLGWTNVPAAPRRANGPHLTVNDLLVAALIETIGEWNTARPRRWGAGRCIRISMPVDARAPGHGGELGNQSRLHTVSVPSSRVAADRDLIAVVADQTRQGRLQPGPQLRPALAAAARAPLPTVVKRRLLRLGVRSLGWLVSDTSLVSNLGNITGPPRFGPLSPSRMWFSTSAHMPRGLSVGAITVEGRLQLCFRYRRALLDDAAAGQFVAAYAAALSSLAGVGPDTVAEAGR